MRSLKFAVVYLILSFCISVVAKAQIITTIAGNGGWGYSGDEGPATAAKLYLPYSVAVDNSGNIYIADTGNNNIRKVNTSGIISTIAGNGIEGYSGDGGAATAAELYSPNSVAVDNSGNIYIADSYNSRIRKINTSGIISTIAGNGSFSFSGDGGVATAAKLYIPSSVVVDNSGNIYIADAGNNRIRKINTLGIISTIVGNGVAGYSGDGGAATVAGLGNPNSVALDNSGNIYISDINNNRIRKINTAGIISTIAGNGSLSFSGDGGAATAAELSVPHGVAVDNSGNIYIADEVNSRIRRVSNGIVVASIYGATTICIGTSTTLADSTTGGKWSSADTIIAKIDSLTGIVTGRSGGTVTISYTIDTVSSVFMITVDTPLNAGTITGAMSVCAGATDTLRDSTMGGSWMVSDSNATIVGGVVTGVWAGTDSVFYAVSNSCGIVRAWAVITINPLPNADTILGSMAVCAGATITLTDSAMGGMWYAQNTNAGIDSMGRVTGTMAGMDSVYYVVHSSSCGSDTAMLQITINPLPNADTILGSMAVCVGATITLTDSAIGGTWYAQNTNAGIDSMGRVTGTMAGMDSIYYVVHSSSCGSDTAMLQITINPLPNADTITGVLTMCPGAMVTLSDMAMGGTWHQTTGNALVDSTGIVTCLTAGTDSIIYSVTNICGTAMAAQIITINPFPASGIIIGTPSVCVGATTSVTESVTGGVWHISNTNATIDSIGIVMGNTAGADTIYYSVTNLCGTATSTVNLVINPLPHAGTITGIHEFCISTSVTLTDTVMGGIWSAQNGNATVSDMGIVFGAMGGTDSIFYAVTTICGTAVTGYPIIIDAPNAGTITGPSEVCQFAPITLTDAVPGGTWSSSSLINAIVFGGTVFGVLPGIVTISYKDSTNCGVAIATKTILVKPRPSAGGITGATFVCMGSSVTLADTAMDGIWSTLYGFVDVSGTGVVTPLTTGTDSVQYTVTNSCGTATASAAITSEAIPTISPITGPNVVCVGGTIALFDSSKTGIGIWATQNGNLMIDSMGIATGIMGGIDTITYIDSNDCGRLTASSAVTVYDTLPIINRVLYTLSVTPSFATYQWYKNGSIVAGATNATYLLSATDTGSFAVDVTNSLGCTGTSATILYHGLSVNNISTTADAIRLYPNPTQYKVFIDAPVAVDAQLATIDGRLVADIKNAKEIDLVNLPNGIYFITIYNNETGLKIITDRVVKDSK